MMSRNLADLIGAGEESKLSYSWGKAALGTSAGTFKSIAKIDFPNVPDQGAAPAAQAVLGGQVD